MRGWPAFVLVVASGVAGCSAIVEPDESRLGGSDDAGPQIRLMDSGMAGLDGGRTDAGRRDAGTVLPGEDAGNMDRDAGRECTPRCEGEVLIRCEGGLEVPVDCRTSSGYCDSAGCVPWACVPGQVTCTSDLSGLATCDARGTGAAVTGCPNGCDPARNVCADPTTTCSGIAPISIGSTLNIDLCDFAHEDTYVVTAAGSCGGSFVSDTGDATFALTLTSTTDVVIELTDADAFRAIDTVVYVRRVCDEQSSQIACDDDVPCAESTVGGSCTNFEPRQSRIRTTLGPGTYYIVADAFDYTLNNQSWRCGNVRLSVQLAR
jgi:hypothetical protein